MASQKYGYMATIGADTSGLASALQTMDAEAKKVSSEIREINNNLKFGDGGTVALQQKYELLQKAIEQTKEKLEKLKKAEADVNAAAESGKISEANQRLFQRELDSTANKLARYQKEAEATNKTLQDLANGQQAANDTMQTSEEIADIVSKAMQRYTSSAKNAAASNEEERSSFEQVEESAEKAAAALDKVTLKNNIGFDESAIEYIENYGKKNEKAVSAYEKYKLSVGETNDFIKQTEAEYNKLNKLLESNADNQMLAAQKNEIKNQLIEAETYKLDKLNQQYNDIKRSFDSGDIGAEQFREFQREVELTKIKLDELQKSEEDSTDAVKDFDKALDNAGKTTVTFGDLVKANALGDLIADGFRKAASAVGDFIKQGITLASDLTEVQNVVDVTFGDGAAQIYEWADAAAESFGMSSLAAQKYNGTIGAMLKSQGVANDSILEMSQNLVGLAGDIASFHNISVEQAFEKIRSGISGETEPLKQLGINMNVANLEAYMLAQGIDKTWKSMNVAEQTMIRYNYLMAQTAAAQGDFARTSDNYANQQRILELQTQNLAASFGEKLLPSLNDVFRTANDKLPKLENTVENIGKVLGAATEFALDNHEAILGLIAAYGTFSGVKKAGTFVSDLVGAFNKLTPATKAATAAQEANNVAAAVNPYVLLAEALAALTVGLITYANSIDNVHNKIKDLNNDIKELKKNTDESIANTEAEIAVFRDKAARYEELRETEHRTAGEEERLAELAKELQQYMPDSIRLIDEQTGAYNSLADSVDSVSESMRLKATIAAYEDEYTELIKKQLDAQKNLEEAQKEYDEKYGTFSFHTDIRLTDDLNKAKQAVEDIESNLDELDSKVKELCENSAKNPIISSSSTGFYDYDSALSATGRYYETQGKLAVEATEKEKAARDQDLKDYVVYLDEKQNLRKISEQEYYDELYGYLTTHENRESVEWFKQLGRYEDYQQKQADAAVKAAEKAKSDQDKLDKEREEAEKKRINDSATALKDRLEIDNNYTKEMYYNDLEALISTLDKESDLYKKYNSEILKGRKELADDLDEETLKSAKEQAETLSAQFQKAYAEIKSRREQLLSDFRNIELTETVKDKDGKDKLILKDLNAEIKKLDKYEASIDKLREKGISDNLLSEIMNLDYASGKRQNYIDTLLSIPQDKLKLYDKELNELKERQEETADNAVADARKKTNEQAETAMKDVTEMFSGMTKTAYEKGAETIENFYQGMIDNMRDVNDMGTISSILGSVFSETSGKSGAAGGNSANGNGLKVGESYIAASTPIVINIDNKKYVEMTLNDFIDKGARSGGNPLHL